MVYYNIWVFTPKHNLEFHSQDNKCSLILEIVTWWDWEGYKINFHLSFIIFPLPGQILRKQKYDFLSSVFTEKYNKNLKRNCYKFLWGEINIFILWVKGYGKLEEGEISPRNDQPRTVLKSYFKEKKKQKLNVAYMWLTYGVLPFYINVFNGHWLHSRYV